METLIIEERIKQIISNYLKIDSTKIKPESTWNDLGADSLDRVEIVLKIETELNIIIEGNYPNCYLGSIKTLVAQVKLLLDNKTAHSMCSSN